MKKMIFTASEEIKINIDNISVLELMNLYLTQNTTFVFADGKLLYFEVLKN